MYDTRELQATATQNILHSKALGIDLPPNLSTD